MTQKRFILLLVFLLGLMWAVLFPRRGKPTAVSKHPLHQKPDEEADTSFTQTNLYTEHTNVPTFAAPSHNRLTDLLTPEYLQRYEGSYTLDELRDMQDRPRSFKLNSAWLIGTSNIPQAGVRLQEDPDTGNYKVRGGEVNLPSGMGVSYEKDSDSGETRTFLNIKKQF
jgi:hypothetical protein